jgi:hypothetical protein
VCPLNGGGCVGRVRQAMIGTPTYHSRHRTGSLRKSCISHMVAFGLGCHWQVEPGLSTCQKTYELGRATCQKTWSAPRISLTTSANILSTMIPILRGARSINHLTYVHRIQYSIPSLLRIDDYIIYAAQDGGAKLRVYVFNKRPR